MVQMAKKGPRSEEKRAEILRRAPEVFGYRYEGADLVEEMVASIGRSTS